MNTDVTSWPPPDPSAAMPLADGTEAERSPGDTGLATPVTTTVPVLLYHSVSSRWRWNAARWWMPPTQFEEHLAVIEELGYTALTVSDLVERSNAGELPPRALAITFDDGFADFADEVTPRLTARGQRATVYMVSGHIGGTSTWLHDVHDSRTPMMGTAELLAVHRAGMEVGAHSMTHPQLDLLGRERAIDEVRRSRAVLADVLGAAVDSFAYPHGYHSAAVRQAVIDAGFTSACAVKNRWSHTADDRHAISRLIVDGDMTAERLWDLLAVHPEAPRRDHAVARFGWRCVRRIRHTTDRRRPSTRSGAIGSP